MDSLPSDIIGEIAKWLLPLDLHDFSLTNKRIRGIIKTIPKCNQYEYESTLAPTGATFNHEIVWLKDVFSYPQATGKKIVELFYNNDKNRDRIQFIIKRLSYYCKELSINENHEGLSGKETKITFLVRYTAISTFIITELIDILKIHPLDVNLSICNNYVHRENDPLLIDCINNMKGMSIHDAHNKLHDDVSINIYFKYNAYLFNSIRCLLSRYVNIRYMIRSHTGLFGGHEIVLSLKFIGYNNSMYRRYTYEREIADYIETLDELLNMMLSGKQLKKINPITNKIYEFIGAHS